MDSLSCGNVGILYSYHLVPVPSLPRFLLSAHVGFRGVLGQAKRKEQNRVLPLQHYGVRLMRERFGIIDNDYRCRRKP